MKYRIRANELPGPWDTDKGPWYDTREEAISARLDFLDSEIGKWKKEASNALAKDDIYLGGGVLVLADLMREHSYLTGLRAGMQSWPKK